MTDARPKKQMVLLMRGFFTQLDKYNRIKMMFLDDYDSADTQIDAFAKKYIMQKSKNTYGYSPITPDHKYFFIKCPKNMGGIVNVAKHSDKPRLIPIAELSQHKVECVVRVNEYNYKKKIPIKQDTNTDDIPTSGWNLVLMKIQMIEY